MNRKIKTMSLREKIDRYLERVILWIVFIIFFVALFVMATKTSTATYHNHGRIFNSTK